MAVVSIESTRLLRKENIKVSILTESLIEKKILL